ncbi:uncharacterized protein LOC127259044 isoform X2 [Andrographis paniculata]|uniref:uncharacterized protein LOC127259044 isoform X2 n=1 Tax=Andrographis paniculata TaxID=175694 RepID=UPI0021E900C1|nr:uncharacterized protein LOC127259044 isoform X2 [Andrographis paniculata]
MSDCRIFSSHQRCCSESRKISIGVLVDAISEEQNKDIKDAELLTAENRSPSEENAVKNHDEPTCLLKKNFAATRECASPWLSATCFNPTAPSSVPVRVHVAEQSPSSFATCRVPSVKLLEKPSAANSGGKTGLESDECGQKLFRKTTQFVDARKLSHEEHVKTTVFTNKTEVVLENEQVQDKDRKAETVGTETLRMELWKILENVSPNNQSVNPQTAKLHSDEDWCWKTSNMEHAKTTVFANGPGVVLKSEQVQDKDRKPETVGTKNLRTGLWKILGNFSPNKQSVNPQTAKLHSDEDWCWEHSPVGERNSNSEKIEDDYKNHTSGRPMIYSPNKKKKTFTRNHGNKIKAKKPTCHRKVFPQKRLLSFKDDWSGRLYDNFIEGSLTSKRNRIGRQSSGLEIHHSVNSKIVEEKQLSESKTAVEKSMVQRNEFVNADAAYDRRCDLFEVPNFGSEKDYSIESPQIGVIEQQKDVEQRVDAEISNSKDQQSTSLLKNRGSCVQDSLTSKFQIISPKCLPESKQEQLHGLSFAKSIYITQGIQSFKSLSSKAAKGKANIQLELSDGRCELNESLHTKPRCIMEGNSENLMCRSSTNLMDNENIEDDSNMQDATESEQLSPEVCMQNFLHGTTKKIGEQKDAEMTGCIPESESFKDKWAAASDGNDLQFHMQQIHEDGLASAVALFNVALCHIKTKLKSMRNKSSAEILCAAAEEILLILQNAESQGKADQF